jgi:hypothetical protein
MMPFESQHPNLPPFVLRSPSMASFMLELSQGRLCYHGHCTNQLKTLGTIFQSIDGSSCIVDCATMGIGGLKLVEKGFSDVVE